MTQYAWTRLGRAFGVALMLLIALAVAVACTPGIASPPAARSSAQTWLAAPAAAVCHDGVQTSGAHYRICLPQNMALWNRELIVYAHGYVPYNAPVAIPLDQLYLPDGTYLPDQVADLGFAFATTSYSVNGLAVKEGIDDLLDLAQIFRSAHPTVTNVYLAGVSEGGLITALSVERHPEAYSGGAATCGPIGDFQQQIDHLGDFRVVFDYFFPDLLPGSAISVPQSLIDNWETLYAPQIIAALSAPASTISLTQVLSVTRAPVDPLVPATRISTTVGILWYNVFATNDAGQKLGGQPYDNMTRVYAGSLNDAALNAPGSGVKRHAADAAALNEVAASYQTNGYLRIPLVTMHTTGDPIVPYWHETLYQAKVVAKGRTPWHVNLAPDRYGHCSFEPIEVVGALFQLRSLVENPPRLKLWLPLFMSNR